MGDSDSERDPPRPPTHDEELSWSPDDSITADEIDETFEECPHCGKRAIRLNDSHYCEPSEYRPDPNDHERERRIDGDPYPDDEPVLVIDDSSSAAYAYHETTADGEPVCSLVADQPLRSITRADAHDQLRPPCQRCLRIRPAREADR